MNAFIKKAMLLTLAILLSALYACSPSGEGDDDPSTDPGDTLEQETLTDESKVHWHGRTHYDGEDESVYFYHTASGFTVTFEGTQLKAVLQSSNTTDPDTFPYFSVMVDGEAVDEGRVMHLDASSEERMLVEGLDEGVHTVTFLKRSEAQDALTALESLTTDGAFKTPDTDHDLNMLFLGGSGIAGNGVFGSPGEARTTENSSSLHAFAYKAARKLNSDFEFVAGSGWGLKWGFNETNDDGEVNIRTAFDVVGIDDTEALVPIDYDHEAFIPDFIVVNLGGNDYNAHIRDLSGAALADAEETFQDAVIEMINHLHTLYPDAHIYWTHTGSINGGLASVVISDLDPLRSFVEPFEIYSAGSFDDPKGSGNHAGEETHERNADLIAEEIEAHLSE